MQRAILLARNSVSEEGRASPRVGAVLARDGVLLGEAFRGEIAPGEHAEFTLLEQNLSEELVAGATLFTTLEPCTARNAPKRPCVERVIDRWLVKVVIGVLDPNDDIRGRGELRLREACIDIGRFDPDLMAQIEELNRDFTRFQTEMSALRRTRAQLADPATGAVGPNGHRVGYTEDGDKIEWVPSEEDPEKVFQLLFQLLLRRNDQQILGMYNELWDKVWWNRHQSRRHRIESGDEVLAPERKSIFDSAATAAKRIEDTYGRQNLGWDDFEWGLLSGRMSALAWVLGSEWDESLDT